MRGGGGTLGKHHRRDDCRAKYGFDGKGMWGVYGAWPAQQPMTGAVAQIRGGPLAPGVMGYVTFTDIPGGTWVGVNIMGLPPYQPAQDGQGQIGPFGFHIHENGNCQVGDSSNPFMATGGHWNPTAQPHGNHAGDFPVLFSNGGRAVMGFYTDKFRAADVLGRSIIIHESPDDYRTQPAGATGKKLACGVITSCYGRMFT